METWKQINERHKQEKVSLVKHLAKSRITQTQAAKLLDVEMTALNNFIHRNRIFWPVVKQGKRSNETITSIRSRI